MGQIVVAIIGSGALSAFISGLFNLITKNKEKDDDIMLLLYHDIKVECKEFIEQGHIDSDGLEVLTKMHTRYHQRGGNGYLDKLMRDVMALPIKD
jgi:hypothetical protein